MSIISYRKTFKIANKNFRCQCPLKSNFFQGGAALYVKDH